MVDFLPVLGVVFLFKNRQEEKDRLIALRFLGYPGYFEICMQKPEGLGRPGETYQGLRFCSSYDLEYEV